MYHHIRDFNNPEDKIGTNLSVSPDNFRKQIEDIYHLGYTPTNFLEIYSGKTPEKPIIITFDDGYENFFINAFPILKERQAKAVLFDITGYQSGEYLTPEQLKTLSKNGIEIGAHSLSHPDLSKLSEEKLTREIAISKNSLETLLGEKVVSFCYPSGKYSDSVISELKKQGFLYATTTKSGTADFNNPFELQRYRITNETIISKILK